MIPNSKQSACICKIALSIGLVFAISGANAIFAEDSLEQLLTKAMENHPDVVAANAKVTLAEAELNATRLQIARQIISLWGNREIQHGIVLQQKEANAEGVISIGELRDNEAKLHQLEIELLYITGKESPFTRQSSSSSTTQKKEVQIPTGPIVDQLRKKFQMGETIELDFVDQPLPAVIDWMTNFVKFPIYIDQETLSGANTIIALDQPITMSMKNTPLAAALQYFQDQHQGTQFVIRDYGILLTSIDQAKAQGYYPAVEFAKSIEKEKPAEPKPSPSTGNLPAPLK